MVECDIMRNNKGQALVEFVIILPVFLLLVMCVIDFGNIITKKHSLENDIDTISDMYKDSKYEDINRYVEDKNIKITYKNKDELFVISLNRSVNITSPILNLIFGKKYEINVEKSIYKNE